MKRDARVSAQGGARRGCTKAALQRERDDQGSGFAAKSWRHRETTTKNTDWEGGSGPARQWVGCVRGRGPSKFLVQNLWRAEGTGERGGGEGGARTRPSNSSSVAHKEGKGAQAALAEGCEIGEKRQEDRANGGQKRPREGGEKSQGAGGRAASGDAGASRQNKGMKRREVVRGVWKVEGAFGGPRAESSPACWREPKLRAAGGRRDGANSAAAERRRRRRGAGAMSGPRPTRRARTRARASCTEREREREREGRRGRVGGGRAGKFTES